MKINHLQLLFLFLFFIHFGLGAQKPPKWITKTPVSKTGKNLYFTGSGLSKEDAILAAYATMASTYGENTYGGNIKSEVKIKGESRKNTLTKEQQITHLKNKYDVKPVDSYFDGKTYYVLIGVKKTF